MNVDVGNLEQPLKKRLLRHYLPSGHRRDTESWSLKKRKRARLFGLLLRRQLQLVGAAASPAAAAAEEDVALDMTRVLLCMTRVEVVSKPAP
jgi:hypothetical protein